MIEIINSMPCIIQIPYRKDRGLYNDIVLKLLSNDFFHHRVGNVSIFNGTQVQFTYFAYLDFPVGISINFKIISTEVFSNFITW